ncbi:MAG TPA: imidazolonepropionase [Thermoanaerobaculia bacterium]|nr:imidazolonepropionase [Thermoanaerobaculia bacterium]
MSRLVVRHLSQLATPLGSAARTGIDQGRISRIEDAALVVEGAYLSWVGTDDEYVRLNGEAPLPGDVVLDGRGKTALPGFIDPHTHIPWAGYRENEFNERLKGKTYAQIAAAGGGIVSTVDATRKAPLEELTRLTRARLDRMLLHGTTFCEAKTGYGLDLPTEKKQLAALKAAADGHPVGVVATALPGHEVPLERRGSEAQKARYVAECCDEILPALAEDGARFVDVFCEHGVFGLEESRRILEAGKACGLLPRLHADELTPLGGARLAAEVGALSADHLLFAQPDGIHAMARAGVVATLLPGTSVFLRMNRYAPAREMVAAGVAVALGTDCNPGSSYTESLPAVAFFATIGMGLTVEEALTAMTLNAAASVGEASKRGSLEPGKAADVVLVDGRSLEHLVYHYGVNPVTDVVSAGRLVVSGARRVSG